MTSLEWAIQENNKEEIRGISYGALVYYKKCLYLVNGYGDYFNTFNIFKYCFEDRGWTRFKSTSKHTESIGFVSGIVYNGYFYLFFGGKFDGDEFQVRVNLNIKGGDYEWEPLWNFSTLSNNYFGLAFYGNIVYIFGGYDSLYDMDAENISNYRDSKLSIFNKFRYRRTYLSIRAK